MKKQVDAFACAETITNALKQGALLTTRAGDRINSMVIGWGHIGRVWERPVFIAYVRESRYTKEMLDQNPEFTVNVPVGEYDPKVFAILGSKSGRNMDKITEAGLTPEDPEVISVPGIREFPLTLECRVLYRQEQDASQLPEDIRRMFYSQGGEHIVYYGEIVSSYMIGE